MESFRLVLVHLGTDLPARDTPQPSRWPMNVSCRVFSVRSPDKGGEESFFGSMFSLGRSLAVCGKVSSAPEDCLRNPFPNKAAPLPSPVINILSLFLHIIKPSRRPTGAVIWIQVNRNLLPLSLRSLPNHIRKLCLGMVSVQKANDHLAHSRM